MSLIAAASRRTPSSTWSAVTAEYASRSACRPPSSRKSLPFTTAHTPFGGGRQQLVDVDVIGQLDPEEVAAVGLGELRVRDVLAQRGGEQRGPARPSAAHTVAIDRSMSPDTQNWCTIACGTMPGEM